MTEKQAKKGPGTMPNPIKLLVPNHFQYTPGLIKTHQ